MVTRFIARFKFACLGTLLFVASGVASAQSGSFSFPMYNSSGQSIGTISGPKNTTSGTCGSNNTAYTVAVYTFEAWQMTTQAAPYPGGGGFTAQAAYVTGGGGPNCPSAGWTSTLSYTLPFTEGCAIVNGQCTNEWEGHGVKFTGTEAIYY